MASGSSSHQNVFRCIAGALFVAAGLNHFRVPEVYASIMPPMLPAATVLVFMSGFVEILGGVGLWIPRTRRIAAWGLIALLIAVFPANVWMAVGPRETAGHHIARWLLIARLPLQGVLIAWVAWSGGLIADRHPSQSCE